jgi:lysophospholipase L1-like esterase
MKAKVVLFCISLFLSLLTVEVVLRFTAFSLMKGQEKDNDLIEDGSFNILAVGESTTANLFSDESGAAWPKQLRNRLKQAGIKANVINIAKPAITTSEILNNIDQKIEKYKPKIIISMMGVNDYNEFRIKKNTRFWFIPDLNRLRIIQLFKYLSDETLRKKLKPDSKGIDTDQLTHFIDLLKKKPFELAINLIEKEISHLSFSEKGQFLKYLSDIFKKEGVDSRDYLLKRSFLLRRIFKYTYDIELSIQQYLFSLLNRDDYKNCYKFMKQVDEDNIQLDYGNMMRMGECSVDGPEDFDDWKNFFRLQGYDLKKENNELLFPITQENYIKLVKKTKERNICLLSMQYPNVSVDKLKDFFKESSIGPDLFIGNFYNFKRALIKHSEKKIFTDRFAGPFGHTTAHGHSLIAENAYRGVREILDHPCFLGK